ncbi:MAG: Gfo/Idh/MocA family protein [Verrucomicrobiales bacterium]
MKIAIIGFGFMGVMHAQIYRSLPDAELAAVVDPDTAGAQHKLDSLGIQIPVYTTLGEMLPEITVHAIDICSPTGHHIELAIEAATAGKHLFIEKPLAFTLEGCARIQSAVQQAGVFAQVGHCLRFWPEYMALKDWIESGELGPLKSLSLTRRSARPGNGNPRHWVNNEKLSGGAAFDMHVHDTDFILHLFGAPQTVFSTTTQGMSGPDHIFTHFQYRDVTVHAEGGWDYPQNYGFSMAFEAVFSKGVLAYQSEATAPLTLTREGQPSMSVPAQQPRVQESCTKAGNISALGGYFNELNYFTECLKSNQAPRIATLAQASETIRVLCAELQSARSGTAITL